MLKISSNIYLYEKDKSNMEYGFSGMMPSFNVDGMLIMCKITKGKLKLPFSVGEYHDVIIELPYGDKFKESIIPDYQFKLQVGGQIIGHGKVLQIIEIIEEEL